MRFWAFVLWLLYLVWPYDLFPDFVPVLGRLDDLIILIMIYRFYKKKPSYYSQRGGTSWQYAGRRPNEYQHRSNSGSTGANSYSLHREQQAKDPYRVLDIQRSATVDEIKQAFRHQANRYHPDKVSHLGEEFQSLANEKFQEIQWAYERILKEKGAQ